MNSVYRGSTYYIGLAPYTRGLNECSCTFFGPFIIGMLGVDKHEAVDILMMPQLEYVTSPSFVGLGYVGRI